MRVNGSAVRIIRERSGLSGPQLAKAMDPPASHGTLYDIESGKRGASPEFVARLAAALKVPVTAIVEDVTEDDLRRMLAELEGDA